MFLFTDLNFLLNSEHSYSYKYGFLKLRCGAKLVANGSEVVRYTQIRTWAEMVRVRIRKHAVRTWETVGGA